MSGTKRLLPTLPGPRRAEEFARLLDAGARTDDPMLAPLATIARGLQAMPHDGAPSTEFRAALRQRLVAVAAVQPYAEPAAATRPPSTGWRGQRRIAVATGSLAAVIAVSGVAVGADRSLPGDPLYAVKRGTEAAQLFVTTGTEDKGRKHLDHARTRLHEISEMLDDTSALGPGALGQPLAAGRPGASVTDRLGDALHDMDADTLAGSRDLTRAFRDHHDRGALLTLRTFATEQHRQLAELLPEFPATAAPRGEQSLGLLEAVGRRAGALLTEGPSIQPTGEDRLGVLPCECTPSTTPSGVAATPTPTTTTPPAGGESGKSPVPSPSASASSGPDTIPGSPTVQDPSGVGDVIDGLLGGATTPAPAPSTTSPPSLGDPPDLGTTTPPLPLTTSEPTSSSDPLPLPGLTDITSGISLLP